MKTNMLLVAAFALMFGGSMLADCKSCGKRCESNKCNDCKCKVVLTEETAPQPICTPKCEKACVTVMECEAPKCHTEKVTEMRPVTVNKTVYDAPVCKPVTKCTEVCGNEKTYTNPGTHEVCKPATIGESEAVTKFEKANKEDVKEQKEHKAKKPATKKAPKAKKMVEKPMAPIAKPMAN